MFFSLVNTEINFGFSVYKAVYSTMYISKNIISHGSKNLKSKQNTAFLAARGHSLREMTDSLQNGKMQTVLLMKPGARWLFPQIPVWIRPLFSSRCPLSSVPWFCFVCLFVWSLEGRGTKQRISSFFPVKNQGREAVYKK